jgi:hypothetical protein
MAFICAANNLFYFVLVLVYPLPVILVFILVLQQTIIFVLGFVTKTALPSCKEKDSTRLKATSLLLLWL